MKKKLCFFGGKTWIEFWYNIVIYNFIFICMLKKKKMELWLEFSNMHNEFQEG
jgi:hypothetical protein